MWLRRRVSRSTDIRDSRGRIPAGQDGTAIYGCITNHLKIGVLLSSQIQSVKNLMGSQQGGLSLLSSV